MIVYNKVFLSRYSPKELGISYDSYYRLLHNDEVTMKTLLRVANSLGVSLKEIMRYEKSNISWFK